MRALRAPDLEALIALMRRSDGRIDYLAGGTDLIMARQDNSWADLIVDISQTAGLDVIDISGDMLRIGAGVTMTTLTTHPVIRRTAPMLAMAARHVGSVQIRNRATLGGNIASAMPAADLLPVLKCHAARVEVQRRTGRLEILEFDEVVLGRGQTCLGNGDLIVAVRLPLALASGRISAFAKLGPREVLTISRLNVAALADYDPVKNRLSQIRIVAGALGPAPLRLKTVEIVVGNRTVDQSLADDFLFALSQAVDRTIPGRATRPYKRRAILGLGLDLLRDLFVYEFDCTALPEQRV
ncbi:MAG: molybdopterin dehydrogenase [Hyphomicrobiales bacterium]|nr:molybdopterin dehydrogenase [Hyphomicrobiales bacterium]MCP4998264.1 molybdopterin dehydrogenase [Hyphomicrobiales bacterium]